MHRAAKVGKYEVGGLTFLRELGAESCNSRRQTKPRGAEQGGRPLMGKQLTLQHCFRASVPDLLGYFRSLISDHQFNSVQSLSCVRLFATPGTKACQASQSITNHWSSDVCSSDLRSNQSILKEISPECSLEGLMLKLKLQCFGHLMQRADSFEKTLMLGGIGGRRRRGR